MKEIEIMPIDSVDACFLNWIRNYSKIIYRIVRISEHDTSNQKDLYQDILFQLWRSIPQYKGQSKESTWIYRVALNTAMVWQRKEKKDRDFTRNSLTSIEWPVDELTDNIENEEDYKLNLLYKAITELPESDRALILMQLDGLSYKEMADVTGLSETHIGVKLNRIKMKLIDLVEETKI